MTRKTKKQKSPAKTKAKFPCNECEVQICEDDKNAITCDMCKSWYHKDCTNIQNSEWDFLMTNPNILYSCDDCLHNKGQNASEMREIKTLLQDHLKETKKVMTDLEDKIYTNVNKIVEEKFCQYTKTQEKLETMVKEVKAVELNIEEKIKQEVKQQLENKNEKESKQNNLIILRLPEQETEDPTEEYHKDEVVVKKIFETTNPELKAEMERVLKENKIVRLGKRKADKTKPRPIKITLPDSEMKKQIFRGCKNLRDSDYKNISVQNDLTFEEREANFKLRQELKERKDKGEDVCIFRGKIIPLSERPGRRV